MKTAPRGGGGISEFQSPARQEVTSDRIESPAPPPPLPGPRVSHWRWPR
jgi:hypothetical protein